LILGKKPVLISLKTLADQNTVLDKLVIMLLGILCILLARRASRLQTNRLIFFFLLLAISFMAIWDDINIGDVTRTSGYLSLFILLGAGIIPFRPWQVTILGSGIFLTFSFAVRILPSPNIVGPLSIRPESFMLLAITTIFCTVITGFLYQIRHRLYKARQKEIFMRKSISEYAEELKETNLRLRETQVQLIQSEKMAALSSLVAGVAHEVNSPLGAIVSNCDTTDRALKLLKTTKEENQSNNLNKKTSRVLENLADLNQSTSQASARIDKIIKALRSFAFLDEAEKMTCSIHKGLEDTITLLFSDPSVQVTIKRDLGNIPDINCKPRHLNQVFIQILENAIDAVDKKGEIRIRTWQEEDCIYIQFNDNGCGISEENIPNIFEPGFTTKGTRVGTGLGLAICFRIVEDHGGEIDVKSQEKQGATFSIRLPLQPPF